MLNWVERRSHEPESPQEALNFLDPQVATLRESAVLFRILLDDDFGGTYRVAPADESLVFERTSFHRLIPQIRQAIDTDRVECGPALREAVARSTREIAVHHLHLHGLLIRAGSILDQAGIDFLVLKGVATAHVDHSSPDLRQMADVDILLGEKDFATATDAFRREGFTRHLHSVRRLYSKDATLLDRQGAELDVHRRLTEISGDLDDAWWESNDSFDLAGHRFRCLPRGIRLAHAASHFAIAEGRHRRLSSVLDMAVIAQSAERSDLEATTPALDRLRAADLTFNITSYVSALLQAPNLRLGHPGGAPHDRLLRRAYGRPDPHQISVRLAKASFLPLTDRVRLVRDVVSPSDEYSRMFGDDRWKTRLLRLFASPADGSTRTSETEPCSRALGGDDGTA